MQWTNVLLFQSLVLTRHEPCATNLGKGLTSDVPTNSHARPRCDPFTYLAIGQEFQFIFDPPLCLEHDSTCLVKQSMFEITTILESNFLILLYDMHIEGIVDSRE